MVGMLGGSYRRLPLSAGLAALVPVPLLLGVGVALLDSAPDSVGGMTDIAVHLVIYPVWFLLGLWPAFAVGYEIAARAGRPPVGPTAPPPGPEAGGGERAG